MKRAFVFLSFFVFSTNAFSKNLGAHVHGHVSIDMAVDKNELLVMLNSPADNFLGFEYKAKSEKEKKSLRW